jgi:hypothetical protein
VGRRHRPGRVAHGSRYGPPRSPPSPAGRAVWSWVGVLIVALLLVWIVSQVWAYLLAGLVLVVIGMAIASRSR